MCKVKDIILVNNYIDNGKNMGQHSFIVLSDNAGKIQGLNFDLVCNVMSSFKNEEQKIRKLKFPGNFPITHDDSIVKNNNGKDGYVKTEQLYFFNKSKLDFTVIGEIKEDIFELILKFIEDEMNEPITPIIDNL